MSVWRCTPAVMTYAPSGHVEQLPSGSWRAKVYASKEPLTGREIQFRKTRGTEVEAQIELGRLLELARSGREPRLERHRRAILLSVAFS
jgi:hypothetical protein